MQGDLFLTAGSAMRNVLVWVSLFWICTKNNGDLCSPQVIPFLVESLFCCLFFKWFLRREQTLPRLVGTAVVWCAAAGGVILVFFSNCRTFTSGMFCLIAVATVSALSLSSTLRIPPAAMTVTSMDMTIVFFLVFLWFQQAGLLPPVYSVPMLLAVILSVCMVLYRRLASVGGTGRNRLKVIAVLLAIFCFAAGVVFLFLAFAERPVRESSLAALASAWMVLRWLGSLFHAFILWLTQFMSPTQGGGPLPPPQEAGPAGVPEELEESFLPGIVVIILLAVAVVVVLLWALWKLRRVKLGGSSQNVERFKAVRVRRPILTRLRELWNRLLERLRFLRAVRSARGTPGELYYEICKVGEKGSLKKWRGETPGAYLKRIAGLAEADGAKVVSAGVMNLKELFELEYYGRNDCSGKLPAREANCLRREIKAYMRKKQWEEWQQELRKKATARKKAEASEKKES